MCMLTGIHRRVHRPLCIYIPLRAVHMLCMYVCGNHMFTHTFTAHSKYRIYFARRDFGVYGPLVAVVWCVSSFYMQKFVFFGCSQHMYRVEWRQFALFRLSFQALDTFDKCWSMWPNLDHVTQIKSHIKVLFVFHSSQIKHLSRSWGLEQWNEQVDY